MWALSAYVRSDLGESLGAIASCTISPHPIIGEKTKIPLKKWGTYKITFWIPFSGTQ